MLKKKKQQQQTLLDYRKNPSQGSKDHMKYAKAEVQQASRTCLNEHWTQFCSSVQKKAADLWDVKTMYDGCQNNV